MIEIILFVLTFVVVGFLLAGGRITVGRTSVEKNIASCGVCPRCLSEVYDPDLTGSETYDDFLEKMVERDRSFRSIRKLRENLKKRGKEHK